LAVEEAKEQWMGGGWVDFGADQGGALADVVNVGVYREDGF
jgi:hypothetical protein